MGKDKESLSIPRICEVPFFKALQLLDQNHNCKPPAFRPLNFLFLIEF